MPSCVRYHARTGSPALSACARSFFRRGGRVAPQAVRPVGWRTSVDVSTRGSRPRPAAAGGHCRRGVHLRERVVNGTGTMREPRRPRHQRRTMTRSLTIPDSRVRSITASAPICSRSRSSTAAWTLAMGRVATTGAAFHGFGQGADHDARPLIDSTPRRPSRRRATGRPGPAAGQGPVSSPWSATRVRRRRSAPGHASRRPCSRHPPGCRRA